MILLSAFTTFKLLLLDGFLTPEETTEYSFDTAQRKAAVYKVSGGVNSVYTFGDLVMIENISVNEGIFRLVNGPPSASGFDRWFYGMKADGDNVVLHQTPRKL